MLPCVRHGSRGALVVFLHWLSGSAHAWSGVAEILAARGVQCACLDLPGFGDANGVSGFDVRSMSEAVIATVQDLRVQSVDQRWLIAGHSMGGKIAAVIAREAANGRSGLQNLRGALLVSPSPPSSEPMDESVRTRLIQQLGESTGNVAEDRKRAEKFLDDNTGKLPLPHAVRERALQDILRMNHTAFRAWLESGSNEDWSRAVGKLPVPALVLAGSEEPALGPDAQREKTVPHYADAQLHTLNCGGHLGPLERPFEVAEHFTTFLASLGLPLEAHSARLGPRFASLLESNRVSPETRRVMEARLAANSNWNHQPTALTLEAFRTLRALASRCVPNAGFDIAAAVESATAVSDGWRFASLPSDADAMWKGLRSLDLAAERAHGVPFVALHPDQQDELLTQAAKGNLGKGLLGSAHIGDSADAFTASEMKQWFEDMRSECAKAYMAHPVTMERVGFTGFADEGGFTKIQLNQREEFER